MSEQEWLNIFGDNLSDILKGYNMTQSELAATTGLSKSTISQYINKQKMPGIKAIINIADALDYNIDDLIYFGDTIR